jgi:hypothetical protein
LICLLDILLRNRAELSSVNPLQPALWDVATAHVQHLVANILTFLVTVEPQYQEVNVLRLVVQVVSDGAGTFVQLSQGRCFKETFRVMAPVLESLREIPIENMASDGGHFEIGLVSFKDTRELVDGQGFGAEAFRVFTPR